MHERSARVLSANSLTIVCTMKDASTQSRARFAASWALRHLAASATVAGLAALVVFGWWYGAPWRQLLGVGGIFGLIVAVDVVAGPLLTAVLASPRKSRRERWIDLSLIASIQLTALVYGMWSVYSARPVILAFEVDRMVVITANEVQVDQLPDALPEFQTLSWVGPQMVALRNARSSDEFLQSVEQSIQGNTQPMRPGWWRPYEEAVPAVLKRAGSLKSLIERRPSDRSELEGAASRSGYPVANLRYLPLTSSKADDWVALISDVGSVVGYANVDGFE
jgi:hypothetical protein